MNPVPSPIISPSTAIMRVPFAPSVSESRRLSTVPLVGWPELLLPSTAELPACASVLGQLVQDVLASQPWEHSACLGELRCAVRLFAATMRDRGALPERMIIALKTATGRRARSDDGSDALHHRLVRWSLREYFRYPSD